MRSPQRRTLVEKEGWLLIDGWYLCPRGVVKKRIQDSKKELPKTSLQWGKVFFNPYQAEFSNWAHREMELEARLAHACTDGKIRAATGVQHFTRRSGIVSIYGRCRHCNVKLSDGIVAAILLDENE